MLKRVYRQCSRVALNVRRLGKLGGRQKECYLDKEWRMKISSNDVKDKQQVK